jgi:glycosyltransferase involved in cell wall biosynthesis
MSMRVLCITEDLDRPTAETFVGLQSAGIDVRVACPDGATNRSILEAAKIPLRKFHFRGQIDREAIRALRRELIDQQYDILHVFSNKSLQNGLIATRGLPIKIVAYRGIVGNVSFFSPVSWLRFLNPRIDRIICVADAIRDYFLKMRPAFLRMPDDRPVTIHKGHSLDWYTATPASLVSAGIPQDAIKVVCVANYRPRKGIEFLVEAIGRLPEELNVHLLLIGQMDAPKLLRSIAASRQPERVHRLGFRQDAPSITAACDVFVLPSVKREGLSRSLIEAMAYGVAPVVTDCGGSPELVEQGVSGIVVPVRDAQALADAIELLARDSQLRDSYGHAARERIDSDFKIEKTIEQTIDLYTQLVTPES